MITPDAAQFSITCAGLEAPMIAEATLGSRNTQASANWGRVSPASVGDRLQLLHGAQDLWPHQADR